ncbi:hypothetical protein A2U01_0028278, partial [Trifolium medium]|nr:hypothetical protein [Trifolium medium]
NSLIADRLSSSREGVVWKWEWRDVLTQEEELDLLKLKELLLDINLNMNCADRWRWISGDAAVKILWKNDMPSKVNVFGWRLLLEKLPTRDALASKGTSRATFDLVNYQLVFMEIEEQYHIPRRGG